MTTNTFGRVIGLLLCGLTLIAQNKKPLNNDDVL